MSTDPMTPYEHINHAARLLIAVEAAMAEKRVPSLESARLTVEVVQAHVAIAHAKLIAGRVTS